jgi:hypothetical protein
MDIRVCMGATVEAITAVPIVNRIHERPFYRPSYRDLLKTGDFRFRRKFFFNLPTYIPESVKNCGCAPWGLCAMLKQQSGNVFYS